MVGRTVIVRGDTNAIQKLAERITAALQGEWIILAATSQASALKQTVFSLIEKFGWGRAGERTREHLEMLRSMYPEGMRGIELSASDF
jgi:hypothetical protein